MTIGWKLDAKCRKALLERFPPRYSEVVADHVSLMEAVEGELPVPVLDAKIIGRVDDGAGVEAMIVSLYGSIDRYDGNAWHIPWSHAAGRNAADSRKLIDQIGWTELDGAQVRLKPAKW